MFGTKPKYYDPIVSNLRRIIGNPEASEAELDTMLSDLQSFEEVKAHAVSEAEIAVQNRVAQTASEVEVLKANLNLSSTRLADAETKVSELSSEVARLTNELATAEAQRAQVASDLATLRAGQSATPQPPDPTIPLPVVQAIAASGGAIVETPDLKKRLLKK
jgi:chromosome segregation ATPase